jgi:hypothetical protein
MFKKGDIVEYDDHSGIVNKVKLLSEVKYDYYTTPFGGTSDKPCWHCTWAQHLEGSYAGKFVNLFCLDTCRLSVPFKIGAPIKRHSMTE